MDSPLTLALTPMRPRPPLKPWWRRWFWRWSKGGSLSVTADRLHIAPRDGEAREVDLTQVIRVHLSVWPRSRSHGWLAATLSVPERAQRAAASGGLALETQAQAGVRRVTLATDLPWSALPPDAHMAEPGGPWVNADVFLGLWERLRVRLEMRGEVLPVIEMGRYSDVPRTPQAVRALLAPKPGQSKSSRTTSKKDRKVEDDGAVVISGALDRDALKLEMREVGADTLVRCPWCTDQRTVVKAKSMIQHLDRQHPERGLKKKKPAPSKPAPKPQPRPKPSTDAPPTRANAKVLRSGTAREALKAEIRELGPDVWVLCPWCDTLVKGKSLIGHADSVHDARSQLPKKPKPKPTPVTSVRKAKAKPSPPPAREDATRMAVPKSREALKTAIRALPQDTWVLCPFCDDLTKAKSLLRHADSLHSDRVPILKKKT